MNFPKLDLPQLRLVAVVLASQEPLSQFLVCLAMTLPRRRWRWGTLPACCGFLLTARLVSSNVTPLRLKLRSTCLLLVDCIRTPPQHLHACVYTVTGDPQMGDWSYGSVATGLQPSGGRGCVWGNMFPPAATGAGLILGA